MLEYPPIEERDAFGAEAGLVGVVLAPDPDRSGLPTKGSVVLDQRKVDDLAPSDTLTADCGRTRLSEPVPKDSFVSALRARAGGDRTSSGEAGLGASGMLLAWDSSVLILWNWSGEDETPCVDSTSSPFGENVSTLAPVDEADDASFTLFMTSRDSFDSRKPRCFPFLST